MARADATEPFRRLADTLEKARRPFDRDMLLNLAFFLGQQHSEWKDDISSIRTRPRDSREQNTPRPVVNKISHLVVQSQAAVLNTKPTVDVLPSTDDLHDAVMSKVALAWLTWLTEPQVEDFHGKLAEAVQWAIICGPGYLKWTMDSEKGRPCISVPSPLDVYVDPYVSNFVDARYIMHKRFMDPEQVYDLWGREVKQRDMSSVDPVKTELMRAMGYAPVTNGVVVHELWHKPSRRHPKGLFVVWAGRELIVEPDVLPYQHQRLPFTQLSVITRPGVCYPDSSLTAGRSPQMELNSYHRQRIQIRQNFASPKWMIDAEQAKTLNALPDDSTGQVLIGDTQRGQLIPQILQPAAMADNSEGSWLVEEMQHVWGLHEVMQGQAPGRVEAARALEILKDSDVSRFDVLNASIDRSISEGFWQCLRLAQQYVKGEQIVQTYSRDGLPEVTRFKAEDFSAGMRVRVTRGTGLPRGRSERQDFLLRMWDSQVIQDPSLMAEMLELPYPTFTIADAQDIKLSRSENYTLAAGTPITPNSWDNHLIHIREHNAFRKTQEYLQLTDETKEIWEYHVQTHEQLNIENAQKQLMDQMAVQGVLAPSPTEPTVQNPADEGGAPAPPEQSV